MHRSTIANNDASVDTLTRAIASAVSIQDLLSIDGMQLIANNDVKGKARLRLEDASHAWYIKIYFASNIKKKLAPIFRLGTPATREAHNTQRIAACGITTPKIAASGFTTRFALYERSYLVMENIRKSTTVWHYFQAHYDEELVLDVGEMLARIHRKGLVHRDFHGKNILIPENRQPLVLIDNLSVKSSTCTADRIRDVARFVRKHDKVWLRPEGMSAYLQRYFRLAPGGQNWPRQFDAFQALVNEELSPYR
ncbi:MAG: lipopolysaccharide kinase InaA family protein [bacterium]